ncbi:MAG: hypothetical protein KGL39_33630 [Patescibacteria group bacterium]|nr:hypothetical protein [Patescibacteria group bacterium]
MKTGRPKIIYGRKVDGLKKFSAEYGFSLEQIKAVAKTPDGAAAIGENHFVDPAKFCRAFNKLVNTVSDLPKGFASWKEFGESRRAKIADVELQQKKGLLGLHSEFKRQAGEAVGFMFNELDRRDRECPPVFAGRSAVEIAERMESDTKSIKKNLAAKFESL